MYHGYGSAPNYGGNRQVQQSNNVNYGRSHGFSSTAQSEPVRHTLLFVFAYPLLVKL